MSAGDFQSYMGPGDRNLPNSEISGYQPVSRIGEVVMNAFGAPPLPHSKNPTTNPTRLRVCCTC